MVAPLVALPLAGAVGASLGALAGGGSGDTYNEKYNLDRDTQTTTNKTFNRSYNVQETYNPQVDSSINYNPQVQIDSSGASIGSKTKLASKKNSQPTQSNPVTLPVTQNPQQRSGQVGGGDQSGGGLGSDKMVLLGLVAAGAWVLNDG